MLGQEIFLKIAKTTLLRSPVGRNFDEIARFAYYNNSKIQNGGNFWGEDIFFLKIAIVHCLDHLWVEIFDEIAQSRTVTEIEAKLFFHSWKNLKIQIGRHFW